MNKVKEIKELYCFVVEDNHKEEIYEQAISTPVIMATALPFVCTSQVTLAVLKEMAHRKAKESGEKIKILKFTVREEIETIDYSSNMNEILSDPIKREQFYKDH